MSASKASVDRIIERFRDRGEMRGRGTLYLLPSHARDFVDACDASDLAVVGLEGFEREADGVRPRLDLVADFSATSETEWSAYRHRCNEDSRRFLASLPDEPRLRVVPTILSEADWRV